MNNILNVVTSNKDDVEKALNQLQMYIDNIRKLEKTILNLSEFKPSVSFSIDKYTPLNREQCNQLKELCELQTCVDKLEMHFDGIQRVLARKSYKIQKELKMQIAIERRGGYTD
jgi:uncharacterized protein Yka (UPF0111/DUF47 family)